MEELSTKIQKVYRQAKESSVGIVKGFLKKRFLVQAEGIFGSRSKGGRVSLNSELGDDVAIET